MIAVGHLFELNHRELKINDTVLTGRAIVDDMQIHHVFQQESVYHFLKFAALEKLQPLANSVSVIFIYIKSKPYIPT